MAGEPMNSAAIEIEIEKEFKGMEVLVMGLGLNGGGIESALFLARHGAKVSITDLKDERALAPSLELLRASTDYPFRYILGEHNITDFKQADLVIKNPGVPINSPYLQAARRIATDISIFLAFAPSRIIAITGSKGKSSTASAFHWVLAKARETGLLPGLVHLGGNIALSPLKVLDTLGPEDDMVLELSSWQLGDLQGEYEGLLKPRIAILTAIMPDHQDRYSSMELYVADKKRIYRNQNRGDATIIQDGPWGRIFCDETGGRPIMAWEEAPASGSAGGWLGGPQGPGFARLERHQKELEVVPAQLLVPGRYHKMNCLTAALGLLDLGLESRFIRESLGSFPGIEHRLEFFMEAEGVFYYNDSAATIPEAAAAATEAFEEPIVLVCGGTDKSLNFQPLAAAIGDASRRSALRVLILLAGTGSDKLMPLLAQEGIPYLGPFRSIMTAAYAAKDRAQPGDRVILSPGCTSFGMFANEFDRGFKWKDAVRQVYQEALLPEDRWE